MRLATQRNTMRRSLTNQPGFTLHQACTVKIKAVIKHGNTRWEVDFRTVSGKMHRKYFDSKCKAEAAASVENIDNNAKS
jgi:hypothetical protein